MNNPDQIITDLFISLLKNGEQYITNCTSSCITYKINNIVMYICYAKRSYVSNEYISLKPYNFDCIESFPYCSEKDAPCCFEVHINGKVYCANIRTRQELAEYADIMEDTIQRWEYSNIVNTIDILNK